jgi:peptide/nickel transport system permease protein
MLRFIVRRLLLAVVVVLTVSLMVFSFIHLIPGDPVSVMLGRGPYVTEEAKAALNKKWGLDQPLPVQYVRWLGNVLRWDLGTSIRLQEPVGAVILDRLPNTITLALLSTLLATLIGIPAGMAAALRPGTGTDVGAMLLALIGLSIPDFWLGLMLILIFSVWVHWLPTSGFVPLWENFGQACRHLILPSVTLGAAIAAVLARVTRTCMLEILSEDYIRTARAKGLAEWRVLIKHALSNALIPVGTVVGLQVGGLMGGAVIIESIFAFPGIGWLLMFGINNRDYPLIQGTVLVFGFLIVLVNLLVDISYAALDPRVKVQ